MPGSIGISLSALADTDRRMDPGFYAKLGVPDDWVVDAVCETIRIHRAAENGVYTDVEAMKRTTCSRRYASRT